MVAVWLPVLAIFVSFTVDFAHFFDYSRNLQNRADAAAMAAAIAYGSTCSAPTVGQTDSVGVVAQKYAGPPNGTPSPLGAPNGTNLPFQFTLAAPYQNQPNLSKGTPANFHMLLNSTQSWPNGANWSMGTTGNDTSSLALCNSRDEDGNVGPMVDVRLTQAALGLFFPSIFGSFSPNINAHARAALEGESSTASAPIAVGDTGFTPCVSVRLVNASTNSLIQTVVLSKEPTNPLTPTAPVQWDNSAAPASFQMPASANVYAQPFLSDCNGNGQTYDDSTNTGLLMINNNPGSSPTLSPGSAPRLNGTGVTVSGPVAGCANGTQYLSVGGCQVTVNAGVTFASDVNVQSKANVSVIEHYWNNTTNSWQTAPAVSLKPPGPPNCPATAWCGDPPKLSNGNVPNIDDTSGIAQFEITWSETDGTIGAVNCKNTPNDPACSGTFGIQQQAFGACNGCDQPDDSGPVVFARVSQKNGATITDDLNTYAGGSTQNLIFTIKLSGLNTAAATDPPTVLRFSTSTNHQTGLIDCGQGGGTNADAEVVYYGCGPGDPLFNPPLNPLFVNTRNTCGNPAGPPWPGGNQQDCVQTTPGQRRNNIICPLVERVVGAPFGGNCNNQAQGTCPKDNWLLGQGSNGIPVGDARAIQMIITSDVDLAAGAGSPQSWIPIRKFATFYVTGWDTSINPSCTGNGPNDPTRNEPYPVKGKRNAQNGSVWGHWINYEDTLGTPSGQLCTLSSSPTNCVPALTR